MLALTGSSKHAEPVEHSVHSTGVPLSERFKKIPSHNPFRPNPCPASSSFQSAFKNGINNQNRRIGIGNAGLSGGFNSHTCGNAIKMNLGGQMKKGSSTLPLFQRLGLKSGTFGRKGYNGAQRQGILSTKVLREPLKHLHFTKTSAKLNFFGPAKTKEALDEELDKYMSKSKSKQKTDLDQELDEYMKHAQAKLLASKVDLTPTTVTAPATPPAVEEPEDTEMEIVESL